MGVSTVGSSIKAVFPRWSEILGLDADLVGHDLPLWADRARYRAVVAELRDDPRCVGALVTSHKIGLYQAAADMFTGMDEFAVACGEISSVRVRDGQVFGAAKDPLTAGLSLEEVLAENHFVDGAEVLCFGGGGAGTAIGWYLGRRRHPPHRIRFVDVRAERLELLRSVLVDRSLHTEVTTALAGALDVARLVECLPPHSLVINATGMGKDLPGTPLPKAAVLPREAVVWELNYRGSLEFLSQARSQAGARGLTVVDGWRYFIHGWSQVIAEVFDLELTGDVVERLSAAAEEAR
ncbi:MAG: hypothetical protein ACRDPH_15255 [Marmoricola sp.]